MKYNNIQFPENLEESVCLGIHQAEKRRAYMRCAGLSVASLGSLGVVLSVFTYVSSTLASSGVLEYVSVALSDGAGIGAYWKELLFSVAESMPIFGIAIGLTGLGLFLWSAIRTFNNIQYIYDYRY